MGMYCSTGYGFQRLVSLITGYTISLFSILNRVSYWARSLEQGVNVGGVQPACVVTTIFLKSYAMISFIKKMLSEIISFWSQKKVFCLKQGSKMDLVINRVRD